MSRRGRWRLELRRRLHRRPFHQPPSYRSVHSAATFVVLKESHSAVNVLNMYSVARFMQIVGLTIPPLAILAQLMERITLGQMLGFLVAATAFFGIGHLMQRYSGGGAE
jgi:hypothetical protein